MKTKQTIIMLTAATLVIGAAVTHAVLKRADANKETASAIIAAGDDSIKSELHKRDYANTTAQQKEDSVIDAAKAGAIDGVSKINYDAPASGTQQAGKRWKYVYSAPIVLNNVSGKTISGDSINSRGANVNQVTLNNCSNIHITKMYLINTQGMSIRLNNCKNITIDSCFMGNMAVGIYAENCQSIKANANQGLNLDNNGKTGYFAHFIQFNNVTGGGSQINYNRVENIAGQAVNPHDILNVYKSSGLKGDSIQVIGNWIRGGQLELNSRGDNGAAGIVVGDLGGSYQVCRNNILVNPGYVGIQAQGGTHIKVDHNLIYSEQSPASLVGMAWGNYSGAPASDIVYAYNKVKWFNLRNLEDDHNEHGDKAVTLISNTWGADINASILPKVIITMK